LVEAGRVARAPPLRLSQLSPISHRAAKPRREAFAELIETGQNTEGMESAMTVCANQRHIIDPCGLLSEGQRPQVVALENCPAARTEDVRRHEAADFAARLAATLGQLLELATAQPRVTLSLSVAAVEESPL
jgi:hypothetical protein